MVKLRLVPPLGKPIEIDKDSALIGRELTCDVVLKMVRCPGGTEDRAHRRRLQDHRPGQRQRHLSRQPENHRQLSEERPGAAPRRHGLPRGGRRAGGSRPDTDGGRTGILGTHGDARLDTAAATTGTSGAASGAGGTATAAPAGIARHDSTTSGTRTASAAAACRTTATAARGHPPARGQLGCRVGAGQEGQGTAFLDPHRLLRLSRARGAGGRIDRRRRLHATKAPADAAHMALDSLDTAKSTWSTEPRQSYRERG